MASMHPAPPSPEPYRTLLEVSEAISRHGDLNDLFHDLADRLRPVVAFDFLLLILHDADTDRMRLHILETERSPGPRPDPILTSLYSPG